MAAEAPVAAKRPPPGPVEGPGSASVAYGGVAAKPVSKELKIGIAVGTIIIPLIGLVMGAIYMMDSNPEKKSAGKLWLSVGGIMTAFYCMLALAGSGY